VVGGVKRIYNIGIVGVGGQGLLTLGEVIGLAATFSGLDVSVSEIHGMSQRGGSVVVYVRIGEEPSPIIPSGGADTMLALELIEAARYVNLLRKGGYLIANDFIWPPPLSKYPPREALLKALESVEAEIYLYDANRASVEIVGSPISANIALLGFALGVNPELSELVKLESVEKALGEVFKGRTLDVNLKLLRSAYSEGVKACKGERI
jgi:indolepyruvate ferredoxin oxidoreductase beta subunit